MHFVPEELGRSGVYCRAKGAVRMEPTAEAEKEARGMPRYPALRAYVSIATVVSWIVGVGFACVSAVSAFTNHQMTTLFWGLLIAFGLWLVIGMGADFCQAVMDIAENTDRLP